MKKSTAGFFYKNGLSIVVLILMLISIIGQLLTGWKDKNEDLAEKGLPQMTLSEYSRSGHFIQATFENWESEFLQMTLYVLLTVYLRQQGSSESKDLFSSEEVERKPIKRPNAPWPVKKGGIWLKLYSHSLSITLFILFILSFLLHLYGSLKDHNSERILKQIEPERWFNYISQPRFWFESFQNWQSEFLSIAAIVLLSIWLREKGSPESKPVDAPYWEKS